MHSGTAYIISNIILVAFWMAAANNILDNRYPKLRTFLLECTIQLVFFAVFEMDIPIFTFFRLFSGIAVLCLLLQYFHTDKPSFKLITAFLLFIATFFSEVLLGALLPYDMIISGEIFQKYDFVVYSVYLFLNFTFISVVTAGLRAYKQRYRGLLVERQWFLFAIFPLSQTITMCLFWNAYLQNNLLENKFRVIFVVLLNFIADIVLFYMIRQTSENTELRVRSEMLEEQVKSQENYYEHLASTYTGIRKMRHDIDNHIYAIDALIENNETEKAKEYIQTIRNEDTAAVRFADCRNTVISSYLEKKAEDLEKAGYTFTSDIHLPAQTDISNPDLICIYGNLLDNAAEGAKGIENAEITLRTKYKAPYLTISCENPFHETNKIKQKRIPELERGIGTAILSSLAEQYDGQYTQSAKENKYYTELILKAGNNDPTNA